MGDYISESGVSIMAAFARSYNKFLQTARAVPQLRQMSGDAHAGGFKLWKKLTIFVAFPVIILGNTNAFVLADESAHAPPEFIPYDHLRIRTKKFPWEMETTLLSTILTPTHFLTDT